LLGADDADLADFERARGRHGAVSPWLLAEQLDTTALALARPP
jgi:hypothetical protein